MADLKLEQVIVQMASLQGRIARQEAELARYRRRRVRPFLPLLAVGLLVALAPLAVLAANPFNDLNPNSVHNANIDAIYNAGVTTGCDPNVSYCPNDLVTREEMASFLARLGGLGDNKPVASAARLASGPTSIGGPTFAANDLVRVAHAENGPDVGVVSITETLPAFQDALTISITVPGTGFVLVNAAVEVLNWTAACAGVDCLAFVQLRHSQSGMTSPLLAADVDQDKHLVDSVAVTYVFPVSAGTQTFTFQIARRSSKVALEYESPIVTALFVPFGSTGTAAP